MVEQRFCKAKAIGSNPLAGLILRSLTQANASIRNHLRSPSEGAPLGFTKGLINGVKSL